VALRHGVGNPLTEIIVNDPEGVRILEESCSGIRATTQ